MSYCAWVRESRFYMAAKDKSKAFNALENFIEKLDRNTATISTIEEFLLSQGWPSITDNNKNIIGLEYNREYIRAESQWMRIIAPYVRNGSYIMMEDATNYIWRWRFIDGELIEEAGSVVFNKKASTVQDMPVSVQEMIRSLVNDVLSSGKQSISIDFTEIGPTVRIYNPCDEPDLKEREVVGG